MGKMYLGHGKVIVILNTNKKRGKICAEILYMRDCRLDFSKF